MEQKYKGTKKFLCGICNHVQILHAEKIQHKQIEGDFSAKELNQDYYFFICNSCHAENEVDYDDVWIKTPKTKAKVVKE